MGKNMEKSAENSDLWPYNCAKGALEVLHCHKCNFKTHMTVNLFRHLKGQKGIKAKWRPRFLSCRVCGCQSYSRFFFKTHKCCANKLSSIVYGPTQLFSCAHCPHQTKYRHGLRRHVVTSHPSFGTADWLFKCEECPYKTIRSDHFHKHLLAKHTPLDGIKWLQCAHCSRKFKSKPILERHIVEKHSLEAVQWFECEHCKFKSKRKGNLKQHLITIHPLKGNNKWFFCDRCSFKARHKSNLGQHMMSMHATARWFNCELCTYRSRFNEHLQRHVFVRH